MEEEGRGVKGVLETCPYVWVHPPLRHRSSPLLSIALCTQEVVFIQYSGNIGKRAFAHFNFLTLCVKLFPSTAMLDITIKLFLSIIALAPVSGIQEGQVNPRSHLM